MIAVLTTHLGRISETFIHRYAFDLAPRKTIVIAEQFCGLPPGYRRRTPRMLDLRMTTVTTSDPYAGPYFGRAARFLVDQKAQVIFSQHLNNSLPWLTLSQKLGLPFFVRAHGYDVSAALGLPGIALAYSRYKVAAKVLTMSAFSRQKLIDIGIPAKKISVIPYGVDVPERPTDRPVSKSKIRCLSVGRLIEKKGMQHLLQSFAIARKAYPELELSIIGAGPLLSQIRRDIQRYDLDGSVQLLGEVSNSLVLQHLRRADIFLLHSLTASNGDQEGLPVSILEAMASGLPVISTIHAGIPEAVRHGETGFLVEERDCEAMAAFLKKLSGNWKLRQKMGMAGWMRAKKHFSWQSERRQILRALKGKSC